MRNHSLSENQKNHSADDVMTEARSFFRFDCRRRFRSDSTGIHGAYPESDLRFLELIVLKERRHFPFIEAPGAFFDTVEKFLDRL